MNISNSFNMNANYVMDSDYCTLTGVTVIDGAVYTFGNDYYTSIQKMMKYTDFYYFSDREVVLEGFEVPLVAYATDVSYDAGAGLFYFADPGHTIYAMDMEGNLTSVDILGNGIDMYGFCGNGHDSATVGRYDGVDGDNVRLRIRKYIQQFRQQAHFIMKEMKEDFPSVWQTVSTSDDLKECVRVVLYVYENPQVKNLDARYKFALEFEGKIPDGVVPAPQDDPAAAVVPRYGDDLTVKLLQLAMAHDGYWEPDKITGIKTPEFRQRIVEYAEDVAGC